MPGLDLLAHQGLIKDVQSKEEGALSSHYLPVQCGQSLYFPESQFIADEI